MRINTRSPRHDRRRQQRVGAAEPLESRILLFNPVGTSWGESPTVSYSYMSDNVRDQDGLSQTSPGWTNTSLETMRERNQLPGGYQQEVERAFQIWSRVADISFEEVLDGGEAFGTVGPSDIRIGAHSFGQQPENPANSYFPPGLDLEPLTDTDAWGDVHLNTDSPFAFEIGESWSIFNVAVHAVGHAIGLEDSSAAGSIMRAVDRPGVYGPQADDVAGAQLIYGPAKIQHLVIETNDDPAPGREAGDTETDSFVLKERFQVILNPDSDTGVNPPQRMVHVLDVFINDRFAYSVDYDFLESITINGSGDKDILDARESDLPIYFNGTGADDFIMGSRANDTLIGGGGDDTIMGGGGDDLIKGQRGDDELYGELDADTIRGGGGNDTLVGGLDGDSIGGGGGGDLIRGQLGDDTINGGRGSDTIFGGGDNDSIRGSEGNDRLYGGSGDDRLRGNKGNDELFGEDGVDTVLSGGGHDVAYGGAGDDLIYGHGGRDEIYGDEGTDEIVAGSGVDTLVAGSGSERTFWSDGAFDDVLDGGRGADIAWGLFDETDQLISIKLDERV